MFLQVFSFATLIVCAVHGGLVGQQPRFRGNDAQHRAESDEDGSEPESTGAPEYRVAATSVERNSNENDMIQMDVRTAPREGHRIPVENFSQMLRDGQIPDREEYAELNQVDKRTNMTKSQEEAEQARWIGDVSPNR